MTTWEAIVGGITMLGTIIAGVFRTGQLAQRIDTHADEIKQIKVDVREDIRALASDVKEINTFLRDAAFINVHAKKTGRD